MQINNSRKRDDDRNILIGIVRQLYQSGLLSFDTASHAYTFIYAIPIDIAFPKLSTDGDYGLSMMWTKQNNDKTVVTLSGCRLYTVAHAGTSNANYLDDERFTDEIPEAILSVIR